MSKKSISVRMDEQILKDADKAAKSENRSRNSLIEWAVRLYCIPNKNNKT
jgi:metal-responsive CopG/Arc/MetJ family transcriptional regulator